MAVGDSMQGPSNLALESFNAIILSISIDL